MSSLFLIACTESEDTSRLYKNLVFDEFNVDQPRGHFAYIEQEIPDLIDQHENVTVGFASRGTGIVKQAFCPKLQTDPSSTLSGFGSGTLTSSTRFTTALHVVDKICERRTFND